MDASKNHHSPAITYLCDQAQWHLSRKLHWPSLFQFRHLAFPSHVTCGAGSSRRRGGLGSGRGLTGSGRGLGSGPPGLSSTFCKLSTLLRAVDTPARMDKHLCWALIPEQIPMQVKNVQGGYKNSTSYGCCETHWILAPRLALSIVMQNKVPGLVESSLAANRDAMERSSVVLINASSTPPPGIPSCCGRTNESGRHISVSLTPRYNTEPALNSVFSESFNTAL